VTPDSPEKLLFRATKRDFSREWTRWARRRRNMRKVRLLLRIGWLTKSEVEIIKPK